MSSTSEITIIESDLKGSCSRLNTVIGRLASRISDLENRAKAGTLQAIPGVASVYYGTAADRLAITSATSGSLFVDTDTAAIYQLRGTAGGAAWVQLLVGDVQIAYATASLTLVTNTPHDITGATLTLTHSGLYLIVGVFDMAELGAGDIAQALRGYLNIDGSDQAQVALLRTGAVNDRATVMQQWTYTAPTAGKVVKLRADKDGGAGTSQAVSPYTSISARWVQP